MTDNATLREAYATLIHNQPWDFYSTITYRKVHRDPIGAARRYWNVLETNFDADRAFIVAEKHALDGVHLHALHTHSERPSLKASSLWLYCFKAFGRTTVEDISRSTSAIVTWYCSKYVTKGPVDNYFFFGDTWNRG